MTEYGKFEGLTMLHKLFGHNGTQRICRIFRFKHTASSFATRTHTACWNSRCVGSRRACSLLIAAAFCFFQGSSAYIWAQSTPPAPNLANYNPYGYDSGKIMDALTTPHDDLVLLTAHRGIHALLNNTAPNVPENSLQAIGIAASGGWEMAEVDVKLTSDNIPVLSHDITWGRESCYNPYLQSYHFDPFKAPSDSTNAGANPGVITQSLVDMRRFSYSTYLRDSVTLACYPFSAPYPPSLQDALNFMRDNKIAMVLVLDIRDAVIAKAAWQVIATNSDYLNRPYQNSVVIKMAAKNFNTPADFKANFPYGDVGYLGVKYLPYYSTQDIAPPALSGSALTAGLIAGGGVDVEGPFLNGFGSEQAIIDHLRLFESDSTINIVGVEVNIKQPGGILTNLLAAAKTNLGPYPRRMSVATFNPVAEHYDPNDTAKATPLFFNIDAYCCSPLSRYFYDGTPNNQPSDTADDRGSINFVIDNGNSLVTTDDPDTFVIQLTARDKRHTDRLKAVVSGSTPPASAPVLATGPSIKTLARPIRILVDGDSMTAGREGDYTWRYRLLDWFNREGVAVQFVGPSTFVQGPSIQHPPLPVSAAAPASSMNGAYGPLGQLMPFNSQHAAAWGKPFATAKDNIAALVQQYQPDLVLVALGFNDMGWFYSDDVGTLASLKTYIANARTQKSDVQFVVADVPYRTTLGSWRADLITNTTNYDAALPGVLQGLETSSSLIGLAHFNSNYGCDPNATTCDSVYDGLHPNYKGDFRIAQAFAQELYSKFNLGSTPTIAITGDTVRPLTVANNLRFDPTQEGVTVTWDRSYGATGYDVRWRERPLSGNGTWGAWQSSSTNFERWDLSWQFTNEPYTNYDYQVQVATRYGDQYNGFATAFSAPVEGIPQPTVSASPTNVTVAPIAGGFNIGWNAPIGAYSDSIYEYDVWLYDNDTPTVYSKIFSATGTTKTVTGLTSGHHYSVDVEAWNKAGASKPAVVGQFICQ